jgi:hypothetical protein
VARPGSHSLCAGYTPPSTHPPTHQPTQGLDVLFEAAKGSLDQAAPNFQRLAEATILRVPPELYLEQVGGGDGAGPAGSEPGRQ